MEQKTDRLYTSAPLDNIDLEQRLQRNIDGLNSFNNSINNLREMSTYLKDRNNKSKNKYKKHKTLTAILKSFDTFGIIATTSSSITLSLTGVGLIAIPISTATAWGLSIGNEVMYELIINKYNEYKEQDEKEHQTIKSLDKFYRKSLQDNVIDKSENQSLCTIFDEYVDEMKNDFFL